MHGYLCHPIRLARSCAEQPHSTAYDGRLADDYRQPSSLDKSRGFDPNDIHLTTDPPGNNVIPSKFLLTLNTCNRASGCEFQMNSIWSESMWKHLSKLVAVC